MEVVDKKQLLQAILRKIWVVILVAILTASASFGVTRFGITPKYEASTKMYVNNSSISVGSTSFSISASELTAAQGLVNTYIVILNSRLTLNKVIEVAELDYSYGQLVDMISAEQINDTEIFEVTVTSADPEEAERIANTIAVVLPEKISAIVEGSDVRVVDYAVVPVTQASPNLFVNVLLAFLCGAAISMTAIIIYELMDDKIRNEDYLSRAYEDIPLLAVIPDARGPRSSSYYKGYYKKDYRKHDQHETEGKR